MTSKFDELSDKRSQYLARLFLVVNNMKKIQKQAYEGRAKICITAGSSMIHYEVLIIFRKVNK